MSSYRAWQEINDEDIFGEPRVLTVFPISQGFLITLRTHFIDKRLGDTFGHQEVTFFTTPEQAVEIAHILLHLPFPSDRMQPQQDKINE